MSARKSAGGVPTVYSRTYHRKVAYADMVRAIRAWLSAEFPDRVGPSGADVDLIDVSIESPGGFGVTVAAFHAAPAAAVAHNCRTERNSRSRKDCLFCKGDRKAVRR